MRDLRYALRVLAQRPGFSLVAIATLALGIGANTAIFTVVNAVLLRPLPFHDPGRLVLLVERTATVPTVTTSWENYQDWRDQSRTFEAVAAMRSFTVTMTGRHEPERLPAKMITASLLPTLGVWTQLGRGFSADDDRAGAAGVALLSESLWRRRFGGSVDVVGRAMVLDNRPYTIVGVMPPQFQLLTAADVLVPMGPWAATLPDDRSWHPGIFPVARLKAGITLSQAQAEMDVISRRLASQYPQFDHGVSAEVKPLHEYSVQNVRESLLVLAGAVGFVLLIACANVANLLLARGVGRRREIAIRSAIGATRARIAGQLLTESFVLAAAGGAAGLLLAVWSVPLLAQLAGSTATPAAPIRIDPTALAFTVSISLATGFVFGVLPALQTARVDVSAAINEGGRGPSAGRGHHRLRAVLVVSEIALATMLVVGAGLLTRALVKLQDVSPGFDPTRLLVADAPLSPATYAAPEARNRFVERVLEDLRTRPGVVRAEIGTSPPFATGGASAFHFNIAGRPPKGPEEYIITTYKAITPGFFTALSVPLRAGRQFTERDRERSQPVAIVNETFVKRFFNGSHDDALHGRIQLGGVPNDEAPLMDIVGVVGDTRQTFESDPQPTTFVPYAQYPIDVIAATYRAPVIVARASGNAADLAASVRASVRSVDADQPLVRVRTMEEAMGELVAQPRLRTQLLSLFSTIALVLSLVGVYGVMAYMAGERTHELGVRVALGANVSDIRALVVGEGARLAGSGVVAGLVGALAGARAIRSLLFGVSALDPATFVTAAVGIGVAALAATYLPARRASRVDPTVLLK
jgi:putative ABC transport system permease protein